MWRKFRIAILLFILATVAHRTWLEGSHEDSDKAHYVNLYPVNMDGSDVSLAYISRLYADQVQIAQFEQIAEYFAEQGQQYGLPVKRVFEIRLAPTVASLPPQPQRDASMLDSIVWSLKFRWWASRNSPATTVRPDIKLYLLYFDPAAHPVLPHSTALSKGRIGLINVFAARQYNAQNNVVIAHELLHTLGATDKYNLANNQPAYPDGYAEPDKEPLYPQRMAELMACRTPISETRADMPDSLQLTLVGKSTAREIGWLAGK